MRLRTSLLLLVLATALPLLAFGLLASTMLVQHEEENFVMAVKARNRAFMSAVDADLMGTIRGLQALGSAQSLARNDLQSYHHTLQAALATQSRAGWLNILLHDARGRQVLNGRVAWGGALPAAVAQAESFRRVVESREPAVGGLIDSGPVLQRPGIPVRVPVLRGGQVAYVLTAVVDPLSFEPLIRNQHLPAGWASGLVDASGRLIARVPQRPVGMMASEDYLAHSRAAAEGWYRGRTLDGADTYTAHTRSELSGWSVGYAIPAELVFAGARRSAWLMAGGVLASLALAVGIALWLGRRIAGPMSALSAAAPALGSGAAGPEVRTRIMEVSALAAALRQADEAIRVRDDELRRSAAELRRADVNKTRFLAVLSHELRNPLAPLLNGITLLRRGLDSQALAQTRDMMERQVGHLRRLIDDLLDMSRIDHGKLELRRERVAVDAIVRNAIETAKPGIEAKQLELVVRYAAAPLYVDGDAVRLSQVVANLLNNAAKFTPAGGRIEIATRAEAGEAAVSVRDTGLGFSPADAQRIFEMFEQLDTRRSQSTSGLGLGLTLARSLVQMHGGRIAASSGGAGQGAEFTFFLPLSAAPAASAAAAPAPAALPGRRRVLVVDDNVDAADTLARLLSLEGFEARACYDGVAALEAAKALRPDVAFVDLDMPGMGGLELGPKLRALAGTAFRLVALTGMGQKADVEATRAAGFDAHLTKPASAEEVLRIAAGSANVVPIAGGAKGAA